MPRALITGVTGQDGSYLAELLLGKGYVVFGLVRRTSTRNIERIEHIVDQLTLLEGDVLDQASLLQAIEEAKPDEVYNLAAQSFVPTSFREPTYTGNVTAIGTVRLLEAETSLASLIELMVSADLQRIGRTLPSKTP